MRCPTCKDTGTVPGAQLAGGAVVMVPCVHVRVADYAKTLSRDRLNREFVAIYENLTSTQTRCTELMNEVRAMRAKEKESTP